MSWIDKDQHANDLALRIRALEEERAWLLDDVARFRGERNALRQELTVLREAARNLISVKGRYHTEIAYKFLEALVRDTP